MLNAQRANSYDEFVNKFKHKKTPDDCYTPDSIYQVILNYTQKNYHVNPDNVIRPFYPGGDFEHEDYTDKVVVDNPPFSILQKITKFYLDHQIKFFLFMPLLTMISSFGKFKGQLTTIINDADIIYENGARVKTGFYTNMDDPKIFIKTDPDLSYQIRSVQQLDKKPKNVYNYPDELLTVPNLLKLNQRGVKLNFDADHLEFKRSLDAMKPLHKEIFGCGLLMNETDTQKVVNGKNRPLSKLSNKQTFYDFQLSENEKQIIKKLGSAKNG